MIRGHESVSSITFPTNRPLSIPLLSRGKDGEMVEIGEGTESRGDLTVSKGRESW